MYKKYPSGDISLWCDGRVEDTTPAGRKRRRDEMVASRYQEKENEREEIYKELKEKHESKYDITKLRLWARMISSNLHESLEEPPNIPAFHTDVIKKRKREESFSTAFSQGAAFANTLASRTPTPRPATEASSYAIADVRMKHYEQLRYAKQLNDDGILTDSEFEEQKENILHSIKEL